MVSTTHHSEHLTDDVTDKTLIKEFVTKLHINIEEARDNDLRHLNRTSQDYWKAKHGTTRFSRRKLVRTSLRKLINESVISMTKQEDLEHQRELVKELLERFPDDRAQQLATWPHSKSLFYQRRKEVLASVPYAA